MNYNKNHIDSKQIPSHFIANDKISVRKQVYWQIRYILSDTHLHSHWSTYWQKWEAISMEIVNFVILCFEMEDSYVTFSAVHGQMSK